MRETLQRQIEERLRLQQQLIGVGVAVGAAELSFFTGNRAETASVPALFALLFVGLALAVLRNDQEITILADHLLGVDEFGDAALEQARWESHRFTSMQGGPARFASSAAQTVGIYGVPVLGAVGSAFAALAQGPNSTTWAILAVTAVFAGLFALAALDVAVRYRKLGERSRQMLTDGEPSSG